jgi:hypothetical protein
MAVFGTSWRVGRIAGIEVRIDSSWAVIALLITYSMYLRLSVLYPELSGGGAVGLAIPVSTLTRRPSPRRSRVGIGARRFGVALVPSNVDARPFLR